MRETRSRTSSGPRRFIGGAAISVNRTAPSLLTFSVSKTIEISYVMCSARFERAARTVSASIFGRSPPSDLSNRHGGRAASHQKKVRRYVVELYPHRDALREADPAEGRIDGSQQIAARAPALILDAISDALDMAESGPESPI